ncbi:MAG: hypothetical protein K8S27_00245 [Candidatus Omnitrophica bacterium]|nr:hypothetical protein [Candidatus Omnitrophota bacterium]
MRTKKWLLLLFILLIGSYSSADTIVLKNGKEFEGDIYDFKGSMVKMEKISGDTFVIHIKQIQSVDSDDLSEDKQALLNNIQSKMTKGAGRSATSPAGFPPTGKGIHFGRSEERQKYEAPDYDFIQKPVFTGGPDFSKKANEDEEDEDEMDLSEATRGRSKKIVKIFVGPSCPDCEKMEKFLIENDVKYSRYDITASPASKNRYERYRVKVLPVTVINGRPCLGYNPDQVRYLLMKNL